MTRFWQLVWNDNSAKLLLASNLLILILALLQNWNVLTVIWGFWLQSIIIGFFGLLQILFIGLKTNQKTKIALTGKKDIIVSYLILAGLFTLAYGTIHLVYAAYFGIIAVTHTSTVPNWVNVALIGTVFFFNHAFSFWIHVIKNPKSLKKDLGKVGLTPFKRVLPLHFIIIFGSFALVAGAQGEQMLLIGFMVIKTLADLRMHISRHHKMDFA
ncbi:MAG: DUF6498-containing protein [Candidatus Micrarchaeota archaeon]